MLRSGGVLILCILALFCPSSVRAEYTLVLKSGGRVTVQDYREEGGMVKFHGLGGQISIPRAQIQAILKGSELQREGLNIPEVEAARRQAPTPATSPTPSRDPGATAGQEAKSAASGEAVKEYQKRLAEITRDLNNVSQRYFAASQGGSTASSASKEGYKALTADLMSRLKDRRGAAPSEYENQEKELSDLRRQIDELQKKRNALIEEMKSKNIPTEAF